MHRAFYIAAGALMLAGPLDAATAPPVSKAATQRAIPAVSMRELEAAQAAVDAELADAKSSSEKYSGGLIKSLIEQRMAILNITRALLAQRIVAQRTGAPLTTRVAVARPDSARARKLASEAETVRRERAEKQAESDRYSGGLIKATIDQNIAMLDVTLATLEGERLRAIYGIVSPAGSGASSQEQLVSAKPAASGSKATKPAEAAAYRVLVPTLSNKRFRESNTRLRIYDDAIYFDVDWNTSGLPRPTRAVKGVLIISDLFGEPKVSIQWTINKPLTPGESYPETGMGFEYNQFKNEHQWMRSTELSDMTFKFRVESIIYQDGTQENFPEQ
jgi:hypothetical protein